MPNSTLAQMGFLDEDTQQEAVYDLEDTQARTDIGTINGKIPSAASSTNKLVDTTAMNDAIGQAVSAAYKPAGNKTVAELTSSLLVVANRGKVYNMTDAGTTTADFVEGAGHPIRIGDDVGICEPTTGTFKFNILSGFIAIDTNPTQGSANPVSSGGVYSEFAGIKDGTYIDSFSDVETALDGKVTKDVAGGILGTDGNPISVETPLTLSNGEMGLMFGNIEEGIQTSPPTAGDVYSALALKADKSDVTSKFAASVSLLDDTVGWLGKNRMIFDVSSTSVNGVNLTLNSNKTFTVNTESGGANALTVIRVGYITEAGQYILNGCPEGGGDSSYRLDVRPNGSSSPYSGSVDSGSGSNVITVNNNDLPVTVNLRIPSGAEISDKLFKPMIRRPNTNPDYEPNHESVEEMLDSKVSIGRLLTSADDLNDIKDTGIYAFSTSPANAPEDVVYGTLIVDATAAGTGIRQMIIISGSSSASIYTRGYVGSPQEWKSWYKYTGTVVS